MISERPDVLKRLVAAYQKATLAAIDDPAGTAAALKAMVPEVDEQVAQEQWEASIPLMVNEITEVDGMGVFTPELLNASWGWVAKAQGYALDKLDPTTAVAADF